MGILTGDNARILKCGSSWSLVGTHAGEAKAEKWARQLKGTAANVMYNSGFSSLQSAKQNYDEDCRWLKTVDLDSLFRMGYLCLIVHAPKHWFLAVICFRQHEICFLDSIPKHHKEWFGRLIDFSMLVAKTKCSADVQFNSSEWRKVEIDVPCQENLYNCGVFSCMNMLHFVAAIFQNKRPTFPFNQSHMIDIRYAMSCAFLQNSISSVLEEWYIRFFTNQ
jgi:sentrin-specific protease 1